MACGSFCLTFRFDYYSNLVTGVWGWGWMGRAREHASSGHKAEPIAKHFPLADNIYYAQFLAWDTVLSLSWSRHFK